MGAARGAREPGWLRAQRESDRRETQGSVRGGGRAGGAALEVQTESGQWTADRAEGRAENRIQSECGVSMRTVSGFFILMATLAGSTAWAAECSEEAKKPTGTMSEAVYHGVDEATKLIAKNQQAEAIEKLTKLADGGGEFDKA